MKHTQRPLAAAIAAATLFAAPALAQTVPHRRFPSPAKPPCRCRPTWHMVDGGVTSEAKTAREASEANNAAMGKVLLALKAAGIEEKDVQTSRLSLQPQYAREPQADRPPSSATAPATA